jgi:hypothetical protein
MHPRFQSIQMFDRIARHVDRVIDALLLLLQRFASDGSAHYLAVRWMGSFVFGLRKIPRM